MTEVTLAFDADNYLGETPIWSVADQALWWVNCEHPPELHCWKPDGGSHVTWPMPQRIGGFVPKAGGGLLVALADGLYDFFPASGALTLRVRSPLPASVKLHECHCDRQGRFWIGSFDHAFPADRTARGGSWFRLDGDRLTPVIEGISVANGLAFSPDGRTMYAADSPTRKVEAFDLDPATGALSGRRPFLALGDGEGFVDGATVDTLGGYWLANVGAGALRRYHPDGTLDRIVALPFSNPTKPAFGGADLQTLYVTSTKMPITMTMTPTAPNGGIYALRPGETGVAEVPFSA
jgi:sugar lactone lactonase YvrE